MLAGWCIPRDIAGRKHAEAEILELDATLEQRVAERSAELVQANAALRAELAQRLEREVELTAERSLLRGLMDALPDLIYAKDRESRFVFANLAAARLM